MFDVLATGMDFVAIISLGNHDSIILLYHINRYLDYTFVGAFDDIFFVLWSMN